LLGNEEAFEEFLKDYQIMVVGNKKIIIIVTIKESKKQLHQVFIFKIFINEFIFIHFNIKYFFKYYRKKFQNKNLMKNQIMKFILKKKIPNQNYNNQEDKLKVIYQKKQIWKQMKHWLNLM